MSYYSESLPSAGRDPRASRQRRDEMPSEEAVSADAEDKYDDDYWAMAESVVQTLRDKTIGLPRAPGGREFRPVSDGPESQNIEDRREGYQPDWRRQDYEWTEEQLRDRKITRLMGDSLLRRTHSYGDPEGFKGRDPAVTDRPMQTDVSSASQRKRKRQEIE